MSSHSVPYSQDTRVDPKVIHEYLEKQSCMYVFKCLCVYVQCLVLCSHAAVTARWMVVPLLSHSRIEHQIKMHNNIAKLICHLRCSVCPVSVSTGQSDLISLPQLQFQKRLSEFEYSSGGFRRHNTRCLFFLFIVTLELNSNIFRLFFFFSRSTTGFPTK